jgi:hypothetical protein
MKKLDSKQLAEWKALAHPTSFMGTAEMVTYIETAREAVPALIAEVGRLRDAIIDAIIRPND